MRNDLSNPVPKPNRRLKRTIKAVRSGIRRYPRAIVDSLRNSSPDREPLDLPEVLSMICPHDLAVMWLGHGSLVAQIHDLSVIIDPVLSDRIGMRIGKKTIGLSRVTPPPLQAPSLRGADLILITHAHFDHLDKPTLEAIASKNTTVIVPHRCRRLIPDGFAEVIEMRAGEILNHRGVRISTIQPAHWGARKIFDRHRGVNSYLVESGDQHILFAGDTAETSAFGKLGKIDLAVFGIGAYDPWDHMHATPEQAWNMFRSIGARYMLPVHHSTFELSDEPLDEPMQRLRNIAGDQGKDAIIDPVTGEVVVIPTSSQHAAPDSPQIPESNS